MWTFANVAILTQWRNVRQKNISLILEDGLSGFVFSSYSGVKRLMREAKELNEPTELYYAQPLEVNDRCDREFVQNI